MQVGTYTIVALPGLIEPQHFKMLFEVFPNGKYHKLSFFSPVSSYNCHLSFLT